MLQYNARLKTIARSLRANPTDAELRLWYRLRRKQILGVQFYRQKTIGNYIVDFYAPAAKLVVEVDGAHHFALSQAEYDNGGANIWSSETSGFYALTTGKFCYK
jgi:very-short-patch-repair endonuclease